VLEQEDRGRFERDVMPHRDAAYNLARWILRGRAQAEDVTQEAFLRAYRSFAGFQTGNARGWLLQIVRNCCFTWLQQNQVAEEMTEFDEQTMPPKPENPESLAMAAYDRERLQRALEDLPGHFREIIVLRELEGCSYKEIAAITTRPIGTVMSALARARQQLRTILTEPVAKGASRDL
jgi:RNA polymerase sigma-70 factor (ECF subfamily)